MLARNAILANEPLGEADSAFSLANLHGFPESTYFDNKRAYDELEKWYRGTWLNETQVQGGVTVDKYPVKLNPIRGAVYKHAYALFGEVRQDAGPLAQPILKGEGEGAKENAQKAQNILYRVYAENHGRTLMMRNAMLSQILGGCVTKISYVPEQKWRKIPIRLEGAHPANFIGVPMSGDEYRLEQGWLIRPVSPAEAKRVYGVQFADPRDETLENVYYVEYWTPDEYEVTVQGIPVPYTNMFDPMGNRLKAKGKNPFGFVPIVYIPHIRTSGFYGDTLISLNVQGIVTELNRREADYGDAVTDDAHVYYVGSGFSARPNVYDLTAGVRVIQLPLTPAVTGKEQPASFEQLGKPKASQTMKDLVDDLYHQFRREAFIPAVSDGEDEGSQRSGQTIAMRMWPLLSHTSTERIYWTDGLALIDSYILRMIDTKKGGDKKLRELELPEEVLGYSIERRWAPILPKDRADFINELVNRASAKLGSIEHLISLLDDIDDPSGEIEKIKEEIQAFKEAEGAPDTQAQMDLQENQAAIQEEQAQAGHERQLETTAQSQEFQSQQTDKQLAAQKKAAQPNAKSKPSSKK